jgi:hypothetical protein
MNDRTRQTPTGDAADVERVFERLERAESRRRRPARAVRHS